MKSQSIMIAVPSSFMSLGAFARQEPVVITIDSSIDEVQQTNVHVDSLCCIQGGYAGKDVLCKIIVK